MSSSFILVLLTLIYPCQPNPDARRLYDDLMSGYNRIIRPVTNNSDPVTVRISLKLNQIIDLNLKSQILTTSMWVNQEWMDHKLQWDPEEYGGVETLYVPSEELWLPDIVLYNNADGSYEITVMTKAVIHHNGLVKWNPPAIYKSYCPIDVQYFPFDTQLCFWKFSSWSYGGYTVDLKHATGFNQSTGMDTGIDLSEYYLNVEWDVMQVAFFLKYGFYSCCPEPYPNLFFNITIRRKTLFYTVNLIVPCLGISSMSVLVFYLPSDSGEKVSLTISILLALNFFLLVLIDIIPSTSLAMPLLGKYLVFTMSLVTLSVVVTIAVLNVHFRSPSTHQMPGWVRKVFIHTLPKLLLMRPPQYRLELENGENGYKNSRNGYLTPEGVEVQSSPQTHKRELKVNNQYRQSVSTILSPPSSSGAEELIINELDASPGAMEREMNGNVVCYPKEIERAITNAMFIAQHIDNADEYASIKEDWKYVAMVLDRIFLWVFTIACIIGTAGIFLQAPTLYDSSEPIDVKKSLISRTFTDFRE